MVVAGNRMMMRPKKKTVVRPVRVCSECVQRMLIQDPNLRVEHAEDDKEDYRSRAASAWV